MPKRVDQNQIEIVQGLRKLGASVQCLHTVGRGCPDLLVGWRGVNYLLEIKMPGCKLTPDEQKWHESWNGQILLVRELFELLNIIF